MAKTSAKKTTHQQAPVLIVVASLRPKEWQNTFRGVEQDRNAAGNQADGVRELEFFDAEDVFPSVGWVDDRRRSMSFFVQITFDLVGSSSPDYLKIEQWLSTMGLCRQIRRENGEMIDLPYNTFAAIRNTVDAASALKAVEETIRTLSTFEGIQGRALVSVSTEWICNGFSFSDGKIT
jgi:hypothetical protein